MAKPLLFIHSSGSQEGSEGSNDLIESLKQALGSDYVIEHPLMPQPDAPLYANWKQAVADALAAINDEVILVGHSLGGTVLVKYLSEEVVDQPIRALFTIAAPYWGSDGRKVEDFNLREDFAAALPEIPQIYLYQSSDDEEVPLSHLHNYAEQLPQATVRQVSGCGHLFREGSPELVDDIKRL